MPSTYTPIASTRITNTSTATYTFSSIPNTYTDLYLSVTGNFTGTSDVLALRFNGDTGNNYSWIWIGSWVTFSSSGSSVNQPYMYLDNWGNGINLSQNVSWRANIQNYANTNVFKTVAYISGNGPTWSNNSAGGIQTGLWRNTSAITSITVGATAANFSSNTVLSLYGIKAA
jgi:hypothetical protein